MFINNKNIILLCEIKREAKIKWDKNLGGRFMACTAATK